MATVQFTQHLIRFFPDLGAFASEGLSDVAGATVAEVITALDDRFPGLDHYIRDEQGALRKHVNVFVDKVAVEHRQDLSDPVATDSEVFILQALSGG